MTQERFASKDMFQSKMFVRLRLLSPHPTMLSSQAIYSLIPKFSTIFLLNFALFWWEIFEIRIKNRYKVYYIMISLYFLCFVFCVSLLKKIEKAFDRKQIFLKFNKDSFGSNFGIKSNFKRSVRPQLIFSLPSQNAH